MSVVTVSGLGKSFGAHQVLCDVSFAVAWGDRVGIVGPNGAGKSTLLEITAGHLAPDAGTVALARGATLGYLTQEPDLPRDRTVLEAAREALEEVDRAIARLEELGVQMARPGLSAGEMEELLQTYGELHEHVEQLGGYDREHIVTAVLSGLGMPEETWPQPIGQLSGGQAMRLAFARLLLREPEILLCDEPTNHLDTEATEWLEKRLGTWRGAILCVSHDRYFLDRVCTRILAFEDGGVATYPGNYSAYVRQREERRDVAERQAARQSEEERRLAEYVERYRAGNRARQAKSRAKRLEKLRSDRVEVSAQAQAPHLTFSPRTPTGQEVLTIDRLSKSYGERCLFAPWSAMVRRGERIGVVGPNGSGKTTLLRLFLGIETPDGGEITWGSGVEVSWFRQDIGGLDPERTVLETVLDASPDLGAPAARNLLGRFLFRGDAVFTRVADLSGGERSRLLLCVLGLEQGNVLLCDEPTNHLDIPSRQALEEALLAFPGTLLVVSHDRYLLQRLTTRIWHFSGGRVQDVPGGYDTYLRLRSGPAAQRAEAPTGDGGADTFRVSRQKANADRRRASELESLEAEIALGEEEIAQLERRLADPALYGDVKDAGKVAARYQERKGALERLYQRWADLGPE